MTSRVSRRPRRSPLRALRRRLFQPHSGQTLVVFALVSLVVIGALGLVLDSGYDYAQRRHMQNVADAAALAGASALSGNNAGGYTVWATVQSVAQQNGLQTSQITGCYYLDHNLQQLSPQLTCQGQNDQAITSGTDVTAVQVTVSETHQTFVMRALGIVSSGSSATATAQVQLVTQVDNGQVPFLPCGVNAALVDSSGNPVKVNGQNQTMSILQTNGTYVYAAGAANQTSYTASAQFADPTDPGSSATVRGVVQVNPNAISYSAPYNMPGTGTPSPNPYAFLIHAPGGVGNNNSIVRCSADGYGAWKGFNGTLSGTIDVTSTTCPLYMSGSFNYSNAAYASCYNSLPATSPDSNTASPQPFVTGKGALVYAGTGNRSGPAASVPGAGGCKPGQEINCVLILPVEDTSVGSGNGSNGILAARTLLAFYMMGNNNSHWGYLIYPYNITSPGMPKWRPGTVGVTTIHLVK